VFLASSSFSPTFHDLNLNGPVPVGWLNAYEPVAANVPLRISPWSAPYFFSAVGLSIENDEITSDGKNVPDGRVRRTTALYLPTALQLWNSGEDNPVTSL
jgi:hypothetical protein